jgi:hypothetical protein
MILLVVRLQNIPVSAGWSLALPKYKPTMPLFFKFWLGLFIMFDDIYLSKSAKMGEIGRDCTIKVWKGGIGLKGVQTL